MRVLHREGHRTEKPRHSSTDGTKVLPNGRVNMHDGQPLHMQDGQSMRARQVREWEDQSDTEVGQPWPLVRL